MFYTGAVGTAKTKGGLLESQKTLITLQINGERYEVAVTVNKTLLEILREDLDLTGTKHGCEVGECGTCTVLINDQPILSCLTLGVEIQGQKITTIEGLEQNGKLHPIQQAFIELQAAQCGYCTPGMLLSSKALLDENKNPSQDEIKEALSGNLCRCTGYWKIIEAVELTASRLGASKE
ncbi:(2Fe-2S)-binding protein [Candidatus Acetothermia bacterium]|nr:(2Fe-2S)-binding protein [Candidatus Acetothermia bacterium]MBI3644169.1 (2Fe-2S)-binding protein [Candidatus Acetothermia bacterium]